MVTKKKPTPVYSKSIFTVEQNWFLYRCTTGELKRYYPEMRDRTRLRWQISRQVQEALRDLDFFIDAVKKDLDSNLHCERRDAQVTIQKHQPILDKVTRLRWKDIENADALEKAAYHSRKRPSNKMQL